MSCAHLEEIAALYDSAEGHVGNLIFDGQIHWGYWDERNADASLAEGADRLTHIMIEKTTIEKGQKFCDLGCGWGGPAMALAKAKGCYIDGITISGQQQQNAVKKAAELGMASLLNFIHGDALNMPCADQTYDGGWFFESIFHMGHREALLEANRILKPGATLLVTDAYLLSTASEEFKERANRRVLSRFMPKDIYPGVLEETGFEAVEILDVTPYVIHPLAQKLKEACVAYRAEILKLVPAEAIDDWLWGFEDFCANLGYLLVTARKK
jgi:cyclopropane fatty-acyl-phospholipid synthase-like methyltransferase